jgi:two-component system, cell cycle sensor histidine kinase and response regulator CckA
MYMAESAGQAAARQANVALESEVQQLAQKTVLLGELAAATAHQFNNIMMAVTSYVEVELRKGPASNKRSLELILNNASRAATLVQKLFALSRPDAPFMQLVQLNSVINEGSELLQLLAGGNDKVTFDLQSELPKINADRAQLEELLMTLLIHVTTGAPREEGVVLKTELVQLGQADVPGGQPLKPGEYVVLSLCSSHPAKMAGSEHQSHGGKERSPEWRSGFLVAAIERTAKHADGILEMKHDALGNVSCNVRFSVTHQTRALSEQTATKITTAAKTILVVEDDDAIRVPAAEYLKMEGFKVLQANSGREAIKIAEKQPGLDLLITDIVMPEMNGAEVSREIIRSNPGLKVLFMSGDSGQFSASDSGAQVLQKPFRLEKLNEKIRALLSSGDDV